MVAKVLLLWTKEGLRCSVRVIVMDIRGVSMKLGWLLATNIGCYGVINVTLKQWWVGKFGN